MELHLDNMSLPFEGSQHYSFYSIFQSLNILTLPFHDNSLVLVLFLLLQQNTQDCVIHGEKNEIPQL